MDAPKEPPVKEDVSAPEIFVDGHVAATCATGVGKFTFFTLEYDPTTGQFSRRIVLRLTMPLPVVDGVHQAMERFLEDVQRQTESVERAH